MYKNYTLKTVLKNDFAGITLLKLMSLYKGILRMLLRKTEILKRGVCY